MKASKFSDAQKAFIIKQGEEGTPGLLPTEMKRLKQLEDENSRLKKIVADLTLDREMLQDVIRRKI